MAEQLIDSLSAEFDPSKFHDEYRERVLDLIERKAAGEEIAVQPEAEEEAPAPDLMAALEASLAEVARRRRHEPDAAKQPAAKTSEARRRRQGPREGIEARGPRTAPASRRQDHERRSAEAP